MAQNPDKSSETLLFLTDTQVKKGIEAIFFAYRSFTHDPDKILSQFGLGRAHHRALYFIGRNPGISINELLTILAITKQSLNRVLRRLVDDGIVARTIGHSDKRERRLRLTKAGAELLAKLNKIQEARMLRAYRIAGANAVSGFRQVLEAMMTQEAYDSFTNTHKIDSHE